MTAAELKKHRKLLRSNVDDFDAIKAALDAAGHALKSVPGMRQKLQLFKVAGEALQNLGTTVSIVIELTDELEWLQDIVDAYRESIKGTGATIRFDRDIGSGKVTVRIGPGAYDTTDEDEGE